jgi:hypothetical protein
VPSPSLSSNSRSATSTSALDSVRLGLDDEHVAGAHPFGGRRHHAPLVVAHQPDDAHLVLAQILDLGQTPVLGLAVGLHPHLGDVVADVEGVVAGAAAVGRKQPPANQHDVGHARQRHGAADGREIEHAEGLADLAGPERGDDQVGRRADQRHHAAEQRGKRQRHQRDGRRIAVAIGVAQRHRQHQGERADIVHEARQHRDQPGLGPDLHRVAAAQRRQQPYDHVDDAGVLKGTAEDQHRRHGDHGGMGEAVEGLVEGHQSGEHHGKQRQHRHDVVAQAPPQEKPEGPEERGERDTLVEGHVNASPASGRRTDGKPAAQFPIRRRL